jgi:putative methionine-R-sulfoxide reductase with GAF domain
MDETNDSKRYVGRVQEEVQRYLREVLDDNNKLRVLVASLRSENLTLTDQVSRLKEEVDHNRNQRLHLHQQLLEVESATQRHAEQYALVEQQNSNLANLYVASYQLAGTVDRELVLQSIQEIVANLIGSEEVGIYEMNDARTHLVLARSFGIDAIRHGRIPVGEGRAGECALSGEIYVSESGSPDADNITACVPLRIDGTVIGMIVIFGLLAVHAATSFYCATLHGRVATAEVIEV